MQRAILVLIGIILILGIYMFTQKPQTGFTAEERAVAINETASEGATIIDNQTIDSKVVVAAKEHIQKLTSDSKEQVLDITKADNFVTGEQLLQMPSMKSQNIDIEQIASSSSATQGTSISQGQAVQLTNPIADTATTSAVTQTAIISSNAESATNDSLTDNQGVAIVIDSGTLETSQSKNVIAQAVEQIQNLRSNNTINDRSVMLTQTDQPTQRFEQPAIDDSSLQISTNDVRSLRPGQQIRLQELLSNPDLAAGTLFYIHAVDPNDEQGLWGILQQGLIKTFAQGIELKQSGRVLTASIPELADETLENRRSSFLGEFLYRKVQDTYVYNYQQGMLGQDPNMIKPGQQLIIVSYTEDELISIFNYFAAAGA